MDWNWIYNIYRVSYKNSLELSFYSGKDFQVISLPIVFPIDHTRTTSEYSNDILTNLKYINGPLLIMN